MLVDVAQGTEIVARSAFIYHAFCLFDRLREVPVVPQVYRQWSYAVSLEQALKLRRLRTL